MRKLVYTIALLLASLPMCAQTIFIANSNGGAMGGTNVFTGAGAITSAVAAAVSGDIIYVVPSNVTYNSLSVHKALTIIGGGFNPEQAGGVATTISSISVSSSQVRLSGLVTQSIYISSTYSNIMIDKCRVNNVAAATPSSSNIIIQNSILGETGGPSQTAISLQTGSGGIKISNNIIYATGFGVAISTLNAATIENNLFVGSASAFNAVANCSIKNNIFFGLTPADNGTLVGNDQQHNISYNTSNNNFPTSNGSTSTNNIANQNPAFTNFSIGPTFNFNHDISLQIGSPAIGSGLGGTDMGVFGGLNPFDVYGTPLPIVTSIAAPNTVPQGSNLNVQIKAKGN